MSSTFFYKWMEGVLSDAAKDMAQAPLEFRLRDLSDSGQCHDGATCSAQAIAAEAMEKIVALRARAIELQNDLAAATIVKVSFDPEAWGCAICRGRAHYKHRIVHEPDCPLRPLP